MILLVVSASVEIPTIRLRRPFFFVSLYILAVGEGGHKPCVQTFAADQFDDDLPEERRVKSSFFNWWYFGIVCGSTSGVAVLLFGQKYVGWAVGYAMMAAAMAVAVVLFLAGMRFYRLQGPLGSPFTRVAQVFVAGVRKRRVMEENWGIYCEDGDAGTLDRNLARSRQFRFLDKAMFIDSKDASSKTRDPWRLCSLNQVEEVKLVLRLIPIWLTCVTFYVVQAQSNTYFTKQSSTMDRRIGHRFHLPPPSLLIILGLIIATSVAIYDRAFIPIARKITGHPSGITVLTRIGIGHFLSVVAVIIAARVEAKRVAVAAGNGVEDDPKAVVPMRVWWLLPQYVVLGVADVFAFVGMQELFYDQMPEGLRSLGAAAYTSALGIGNFMSSGIISAVQGMSLRYGRQKWLVDNLNRAHLDYFYLVIAGFCSLNLCAFVWISKGFVYKKLY
ncbi:hypothetical protein Nepgr_032045 [Nepenthes gracilis]|uniref:Uncharacterized protein n=1 Tax=Nepenthes gracilis TaxID=150966 RepID=A0AAD3TIQ5_NEPGR|nr:hypothetical protein Nepgr_032045 [Nepenthes gracilis]